GFNKSHSAAYALLAYQTAYLKAHYPAAFMAAVLSAEMGNTDKVVTLIKECTDLGLAVLPPDVNASGYEFAACGERSIRYGLGARARGSCPARCCGSGARRCAWRGSARRSACISPATRSRAASRVWRVSCPTASATW